MKTFYTTDLNEKKARELYTKLKEKNPELLHMVGLEDDENVFVVILESGLPIDVDFYWDDYSLSKDAFKLDTMEDLEKAVLK